MLSSYEPCFQVFRAFPGLKCRGLNLLSYSNLLEFLPDIKFSHKSRRRVLPLQTKKFISRDARFHHAMKHGSACRKKYAIKAS